MALVNCPECGKERVSDTAEACPDCGYGIKRHFVKIAEDLAKKEARKNEPKALVQYCPYCGRIDIFNPKFDLTCNSCRQQMILLPEDMDINHFRDLDVPELGELNIPSRWERKVFHTIVKDNPLFNQNTYEVKEAEREAFLNSGGSFGKAKCPTCGSTKVSPITVTQKVGGGLIFGLFSSNVRKSYQCSNCGYKW